MARGKRKKLFDLYIRWTNYLLIWKLMRSHSNFLNLFWFCLTQWIECLGIMTHSWKIANFLAGWVIADNSKIKSDKKVILNYIKTQKLSACPIDGLKT